MENLSKRILICVCTIVFFLALTTNAQMDTIRISTFAELNLIGRALEYPLSGNYLQIADIDADNAEFVPIGTSAQPFTGTFNGNGHTIARIRIAAPATPHVGFFGVASGARITGVRLDRINIRGGEQNTHIGGLVGLAASCSISLSSSEHGVINRTGHFVGVGDRNYFVGGLVGYVTNSFISQSHFTGTINNAGSFERAVGSSGGTVWSHSSVGGLAGTVVNDGVRIENSYAIGSIRNSNNINSSVHNRSYVGGLVGEIRALLHDNSIVIERCYATSDVVDTTFNSGASTVYVGGLVGHIRLVATSSLPNTVVIIRNCYATGNVTGNGGGTTRFTNVSGLVNMDIGRIENCYSIGRVTQNGVSGGNGLIGLGSTVTNTNTINSFFDTQTSGRPAGTEGRTTAQMQSFNTFTGWDFTDVWGIDGGRDYPYLRTLQYTLTYSANPNGQVTGQLIQTTNPGRFQPVTAVPNTDFNFLGWSDGVQSATRHDLFPSSNITVTAMFGKDFYSLNYSAGIGGSLLDGNSTQTVAHGANAEQVVAVADNGFVFVRWSDGSTANPRTDTNVTNDLTVTALFGYTLTYSAGTNGTIQGTALQRVVVGESGTAIMAVPASGHHFVRWSDGSTANPRTDANVNSNIVVAAEFAINTYTLTYQAGANGTIEGVAIQTISHGGDGTLVRAIPNEGYYFVRWSDGLENSARVDIDITSNTTFTAEFAIRTFTLTYIAGANGTIGGRVAQTVDYGADGMQIYAIPNNNFVFTEWSDGITANPRQDRNVRQNITVTAHFADGSTVSVNSNDRIVPPTDSGSEASVIAPVALSSEFTVGPNPVDRQSSSVAFFWQGRGIDKASLAIYDATGNLVRRITINDPAGTTARRQVGIWDLKDRRGRLVAEGSYVVRGTVTARDGKKERVSLMIGVR